MMVVVVYKLLYRYSIDMSCPNCNQNLLDGIYYCDTSDYRVIDTIDDKNLIFIFKTHDIPSDDIEINDNSNIQYCNANNCKYIVFP